MQFGFVSFGTRRCQMAMARFSVVGIACRELGNFFIQKAVVHGVQDFAVQNFFELLQIDDEAGARIDFAFNGDFQRVVVAVTVAGYCICRKFAGSLPG